MARLAITIDVPDIARGEAFYCAAWDVTPGRRTDDSFLELDGLGATVCLIAVEPGTTPAPGAAPRRFERHWCPVHCDIVVDDLDTAVTRAVGAGARCEGGIRDQPFGRIATLADPFGHGFCLIEESVDART